MIDAYSRRIVGWRTATSMNTQLVLDAIEHAIWTRAREGITDLSGPRLKVVNYQEPQTAVHIAHPWRIFGSGAADQLPRWGKNMMVYHAESHLMRSDLDDVVTVYEPDPDRRAAAFDVAEYLMGLASFTEKNQLLFVGEAALRGRYLDGPLPSAAAVRARIEDGQGNLLTDLFAGDAAAAVVALDLLDKEIERVAQRDRFR